MRDPRHTGLDPTTLLIAAVVGLVLFLLAGVLFAQATPSGVAPARCQTREWKRVAPPTWSLPLSTRV